ncbi:hypothetical protein SERLA73DRAFT_157287 [Serpula lacrymans var. lacrymans S7.3]|uniref:Uncharacterized protein n=1 Tax=Serpula lacrymans var. lacrymans (strain S7.3) TaxID=936435 RepID=F8QIB7_SERL3|nr:hypothetical protein SERLA73DRAFT_157287 [Serpula lacrymans var. lacrymans S7.3]
MVSNNTSEPGGGLNGVDACQQVPSPLDNVKKWHYIRKEHRNTSLLPSITVGTVPNYQTKSNTNEDRQNPPQAAGTIALSENTRSNLSLPWPGLKNQESPTPKHNFCAKQMSVKANCWFILVAQHPIAQASSSITHLPTCDATDWMTQMI